MRNEQLADILRPDSFDTIVGQAHLFGPRGVVRRMVESGRVTNMIFFGPPGTGKTTAAAVIAARSGMLFRRFNCTSATLSEVKDGAWWGDNLENNVVPMLEKYGLYATARLEKPINSMKSESDSATVIEGFTTILDKLGDRVLRIDGRPVIAQFSMLGLTPEMVEDWKVEYFSKYGTVPFFMATAYEGHMADEWNGTLDGYYGWVGLEDKTALGLEFSKTVGDYTNYVTLEQAINNHPLQIKRIEELFKQGKISFYSESVTPSFDDIAVWGWSTSPSRSPQALTISPFGDGAPLRVGHPKL